MLNSPEQYQSRLIQAAWDARRAAYAPYSKFAVGAALMGVDGRIFRGTNVENLSFGLTMCAERAAVGTAVTAGVREWLAVAIVAETAAPITPCGACRQVLAEFAPELLIWSVSGSGEILECTLNILLPRPSAGILNRGAN